MNPTTDDDRAKGVLNADPALEGILSQLREAIGDSFVGARARPEPARPRRPLDRQDRRRAARINQDSIEGQLTLDTDKLSDMP